MTNKLKISLCTSCKGRLEHLKQTLPANLKTVKEAGYENVEFVVLDYGDEPALGEWIKENYQDEMKNGRLKYVRYPDAKAWEMSHPRNMSFRMGTGEVLCNVDADNFIGEGFCDYLDKEFSENSDIIIRAQHGTLTDRLAARVFPDTDAATCKKSVAGRIAITPDNFKTIRGYDESIIGWGGEDDLLVMRANNHDIELVTLNDVDIVGAAIKHGDDLRIAEFSDEGKTVSEDRLNRSLPKRIERRFVRHENSENSCNIGGNVGCGTVYVNFSDEPTVIEPLEPPRGKQQYNISGASPEVIEKGDDPLSSQR